MLAVLKSCCLQCLSINERKESSTSSICFNRWRSYEKDSQKSSIQYPRGSLYRQRPNCWNRGKRWKKPLWSWIKTLIVTLWFETQILPSKRDLYITWNVKTFLMPRPKESITTCCHSLVQIQKPRTLLHQNDCFSRATIPIIDISPVLIIIVGTPVVKGFWMGTTRQSAHISLLATRMRSVDKQSDANSSRTNKLNATVMPSVMVHLLEKSFFFSLDTTRYNMIQPKSQNTQQTSTNGPNWPSPSVRLMPLYATQSQVAKILSIASSKAVLCLPSRSTEHFTQNHQWQSTILRYPSFRGAQSEIILHWIS